LDDHRIEFGSDDCVGGADLETGGVHAVFTDIAHQQPATLTAIFGELLDKLYVTPVLAIETTGVVIAVAAKRIQTAIGAGQLIPLFAGDFTSFAANANRRICVESHGFGHCSSAALQASEFANFHS
jgi:hypothetical protein